ncbi:MAG: response regulator [Candidatus Pacebacteria bacterium]|nr:response regulator [Candidatus Paceibacterota bacterium]
MKKILIIEDEPILSDTIKDELEDSEVEVIQAFNGEEGLKMAQETIPDIILLDIVMPKLNGIETLKKLKADPNPTVKNIPVVILTVHGDLKKISNTIELGAKAYFIKDQQSLSEITKTIKDILHIS